MFSETHLDIFNTQTAEWVQSIGLKRSQPLSQQGNIVLTYVNDAPYIVYLANIHTSKLKLKKCRSERSDFMLFHFHPQRRLLPNKKH